MSQELLAPSSAQPSGAAVLFYRLICRLAQKLDPQTGEPRGYAFAFCKWYAAQFQRTVRTVYGWIRQLRDAGWIETQCDEGVRIFIRPLLPVAPPRSCASPRPRKPFVQKTLPQAPVAESLPKCPSISGVTSPAVSGAFPVSTVTTEEKKQRALLAEDLAKNPISDSSAATRSVVALMQKCGIEETLTERYLQQIPLAALEDACRYTLRRIEKGLSSGAGLTIAMARHLANGTWSLPGWHSAECGVAERRDEREQAATNRIITAPRPAKPKLAIPADWLPGIPEALARTLVTDAYIAIRNGTGRAPDPLSEVVRDQARLFYAKRHGLLPGEK